MSEIDTTEVIEIDTTDNEIEEFLEAPSLESIVESLVAELAEWTSAYGVHKVVNATFDILGLDMAIPPQMMYNYSRNGMLGRKKVNGVPNTNHSYNHEQIFAFVVKFVGKRTK